MKLARMRKTGVVSAGGSPGGAMMVSSNILMGRLATSCRPLLVLKNHF